MHEVMTRTPLLDDGHPEPVGLQTSPLAEPGGASATVEDRDGGPYIVIRDRGGAVVIEFDPAHGRTTIHPPAGDLEVRVPGSMAMRAAGHLDLEGREGVAIRTSGVLDLHADRARLTARDTSVTGRSMKLHLREVVAHLSRAKGVLRELHLQSDRIISRTREMVTSVEGLWRTRAGRIDARVDEDYDLWAGRTSMRSKGRTRIDGKEIHLG